MKAIGKLMFAAAIALILSASCSDAADVAVTFSLTDAPIDESVVTAVNVTISSIAVNESADAQISAADGSWTVVELAAPVTLDLLSLQNGVSEVIDDTLTLAGGTQINQIRLGVDSVQVMEGDVAAATTMPSSTGLKIVNAFQIPLSGAVGITIDFDVRKSVVASAGGYLVKPVLRAVIDNEAGKIAGTVPSGVVTVYAYEDGAWTAAEETAATSDGLYFTEAYTSAAVVEAPLSYALSFLDPGVYDLFGVDASGAVVAELADVAVAADATTANQALVAVTP